MLLYNNIMSDINESGILIPDYNNKSKSIISNWASLLSSIASSAAGGVTRMAYNSNKLSKVGTDQDAEKAAADKAAADEDAERIQSDAERDKKNAQDSIGDADENSEDSFILAMVFKIVPIGVNIGKKAPVLAEGLKSITMSIINMITNLGILAVILFADTFSFVVQSFYFVFTMLLCMVFNLTNLPKCILFYLFDLFLLAVFMIIMSVLLLIDVFFGIKKYLGISCVEALMMAIGSLGDIDAAIHGATGVHVFSYPDFILNLCYRCEMAGNLSGFYKASGKMGYDLGILVPEGIGGPIGEFVGGILDMVSIFSI
jgi:hypothetical protein